MEGFPDGFKISPVSGEKAELLKMFKGHAGSASVEVAPRGWVLSAAYEKYYQQIKDFEYFDGDVLVMTYPKSGTTWLQEIVWNMLNNPNQDSPMKDYPLSIKSPTIEVDVTVDHMPRPVEFGEVFQAQFPGFDMSHGMFLHLAKHTPLPRTIKLHLSFDHISPTALSKAKVVYVIRDPRDTCISFYHYAKLFKHEGFEGTLDDFVNVFLADANRHGTYWASISEAWKRKDHPNLHIVFYENFKKNPTEQLSLLNDFLGTKLSEEQLKNLEHYTSFEEMKKRDNHIVPKDDMARYVDMALVKQEGGFFRKGESGGWRKVLSEDQKARFAQWIQEKCPDPRIMEIIETA